MMNRFAMVARKKLLRRGRAILRAGHEKGSKVPAGGLSSLPDDAREELAEIHASLERIERGIYGRCDTCFGDIEIDRLEAELTQRTCGGCAARVQPTTPVAGASDQPISAS